MEGGGGSLQSAKGIAESGPPPRPVRVLMDGLLGEKGVPFGFGEEGPEKKGKVHIAIRHRPYKSPKTSA